jgi:hypothetical protein
MEETEGGVSLREVTLRLSAHEMHEIVKALGERKSEYSAELYLKMKDVFYNWSKLPEVKEPEHPNCLGITLNFDGAEKEIDQLAEKIAKSLSEAIDNIDKFF